MADLSYITLPNNVTYNFKDEGARAMIPSLPLSIANGGTGAVDCEGAVGNLFNNYGYYKYVPAEDPVEDVDHYFVGFGGVYNESAPAALNIDATNENIGVGCFSQGFRVLELASDWMANLGLGEVIPATNDILTDALDNTKVGASCMKVFRGSGSAYTGTVPSGIEYGTFIVNKRASSSIQVLGIPYNSIYPIAINCYTSGAWQGWYTPIWNRYADKTQTVTFTAGTIGSRAQAYSWNATSIGGNPVFMQIINSSGLASFMPICTIASNIAYLNIYRSVSTALSNGSITVRIWYTA